MFWKPKNKSPLDRDAEDWQIECWQWLSEGLAPLEPAIGRNLVLPTDEFFAPTSTTGHYMAEHVLRCVTEIVGVSDWPFDLVAQDQSIDPAVGPLAVVQNVETDPHGTFSLGPQNRIRISYNPALVDQPVDLIATLAHEVCHGVVLLIPEPPPGGAEFEEYAVDLATAFLGFGIFGANTAFQFQQFSNIGAGSQGWSSSRVGYLTETEWAFALAIFLSLRGETKSAADKWLKPGLAKLLAKSMKYLAANPDRLASLGS